MLRVILVNLLITLSSGFIVGVGYHSIGLSKINMNEGKGFGGGEATRDPLPTSYDPNDPKSKQTAIFKAETFAEYMARRTGSNKVEEVKKVEEKNVGTYAEYMKTRNLEEDKKRLSESVLYKLKNPYNRGNEGDN